MKKRAILMGILLSFLMFGNAFGDTFMSPLTWQDIEQGYTNYCWAASASDVLAATGWTTPTYPTAQAIYQDFVTHWPNEGNSPQAAFSWYLYGTPPQIGLPQLTSPGGNGNFPGSQGSWFFPPAPYSATGAVLDSALKYLSLGDGVSLSIFSPSLTLGHTLSLWGIDYSGSTYNGLWVTNSADGQNGLVYYPVYQGTAGDPYGKYWYLGGSYAGWLVGEVDILTCNSVSTSVPEPSTLLLLGMGLVGVAAIRKKKGGEKDGTEKITRKVGSV